MSCIMRSLSLGLRIYEVEELCYPGCKNKGANWLCSDCIADLHLCFDICNNLLFFIYDAVHIILHTLIYKYKIVTFISQIFVNSQQIHKYWGKLNSRKQFQTNIYIEFIQKYRNCTACLQKVGVNLLRDRPRYSVGRVSAPRSGGTGFNPGPRHTKVVNNGTCCSPLGTLIFGVGLVLVTPVSV